MADPLIPKIGGSPLGPVRADPASETRLLKQEKIEGPSFKELLEGKLQSSDPEKIQSDFTTNLKFSKHALDRLESRSIGLNDSLMKLIERGVDLVEKKGGKNSLVMTEEGAFIVNVPTKTVVTALAEGKDRVFSNIDSAVIV